MREKEIKQAMSCHTKLEILKFIDYDEQIKALVIRP